MDKNKLNDLKKMAEKIEPKITGWDHYGHKNFLWAEYDYGTPFGKPLGKIRGIALETMEIYYS